RRGRRRFPYPSGYRRRAEGDKGPDHQTELHSGCHITLSLRPCKLHASGHYSQVVGAWIASVFTRAVMDNEFREPDYIPPAEAAPSRRNSRYLLLAVSGLALLIAILLGASWIRPKSRFPIVMNGRFGYIDYAGKLVVPAQFNDAG